MKKILFSLLTIGSLSTVSAQTVIFEDSFETYTNFAIANVGNWTLTDVDQETTFIFNGVTFENSGVAKSFQVFNPALTTPPLTTSATNDWTARTGSQSMVSFGADTAPWSNDWLISPQVQLIAGQGASLSFWGKGCASAYGLEKFKVLVSTTGTATSDFTAISPVVTTPSDSTWHEYTFNLNAYSGQQIYVAIQCTSADQFGFAVDDFKIVSTTLPTVAPSCSTLNAPANAATNVPFSSISLAWTAAADADSYDVYLDQNPNPTTLVGNVTSPGYSATGLIGSTTYYWKVIPKNNVGAATGCAVFSFTTAAPAYCAAGATSTSWEKIINVTFADINHNSTSGAGYEDFTSVIGNVTAGSTYNLSVTGNSSSYEEDQVIVWIDLNNDKDFDDEGEQVFISAIQTTPWTGSVTIPATAIGGSTRMRVRLHDSALTPNSTPCGNSTFGQVEDYTLNIANLAVSDVAKNSLKVYPNPVVDVMNVESAAKVKSVSVYDATGKLVSSNVMNAVKSQVNLSKLTAGAYVVTIETENGTQSVKIIKK